MTSFFLSILWTKLKNANRMFHFGFVLWGNWIEGGYFKTYKQFKMFKCTKIRLHFSMFLIERVNKKCLTEFRCEVPNVNRFSYKVNKRTSNDPFSICCRFDLCSFYSPEIEFNITEKPKYFRIYNERERERNNKPIIRSLFNAKIIATVSHVALLIETLFVCFCECIQLLSSIVVNQKRSIYFVWMVAV